MKIVSAEISILDLQFSQEFAETQGSWHPVLLKLVTDEGLVGLGEAGLAYGVGHNGAVGMLKDFVETFIIGANPFDREVIWNKMQRFSFWGGSCGPVVNACMSAIDIALWDIAGKALNQPIWQMLGGRVQDELRCYASQLQFGWDKEGVTWYNLKDPEEYANAAIAAINDGYTAVKVDPIMIDEQGTIENPNKLKGALDKKIVNRAVTRVAAIREAVGPDTDIILELHSLTSLTGGQKLAEACAQFDLFMVEEAVNYNSSGPAETLKKRMPTTPMAGGERVFTRWQYKTYLETACFDMIQPDFCLAGGITEGKKICDMAHTYEVGVQGHVCGSPISAAAAIHVSTAIPNFEIYEHHTNANTRANRNICIQDQQPENGLLVATDAPGLGIDLNDEFVAKNGQTIRV
ncbi:mandelate racemase/muconate lactonizing enzyme family protein [Polycladidibacter stylochi]|uniref:mandelate racemase/muconate lactonizing enzyme family protein n=1 Tax=Polycladidibacter stylochi TaxID=1807766 RepID=UPI000834741B|nr:mandelate racemase/muconate lactonizing enzyme family protein [Pseudovibrio stylochi]